MDDDPAPGQDPGVRIVLLVASRPGIGAIERAERAGVPVRVMPRRTADGGDRGGHGRGAGAEGDPEVEPDIEPEAAFLLGALEAAEADLVVLAGWLRLVPMSVVRAFRGRMVNIHPALLPAFGGKGMYGRHVHEAVLDSGVRVTGATVHFVDEAYDRGPILAQWPVPVHERDDAAALAARVLEVEHRLLPAAVRALAEGRVTLRDGGRCRWTRPLYPGDRFVLDGGDSAPDRGFRPGAAAREEAT